MKKSAFVLIFLIALSDLFSQNPYPVEPLYPRYNIGFGGGIDYGGFGGRFTMLPTQGFEFFGALGYNILGVGANAGVDLRLMPKSRICPYFGAMYGYNAVIKVKGASYYNQTYYGPSWNIGFEFWSRKNPGFFNLELIIPMRSSEYKEDLKSLQNNSSITFSNEPLPIAISIGYHLSL
jgi:hypothetical protein